MFKIRLRVPMVAVAGSAIAIAAEKHIASYLADRPYKIVWRNGVPTRELAGTFYFKR